MKIFHIIDSGGLYGAEVMLLNLVEEQVSQGLQPVIASIGEKNISEKPFETEALKRGLALIKFRMMPGPNISGAIDLLKYAQNNGFHVIHSHGYKGNILLGFIPRIIRRLPMVATLHGYTSTSGLSKMKIYEWLDTLSHRFMDAIVLVNKGMLNHPEIKKQKTKFHIINNGIAININSSSTNTNISGIESFCNEGYIIGSIGRLSTEKGYTYLVEALRLLVNKGINAKLVLMGDGYLREELELQAARSGIADRVLFTGYVYNARQCIPFFNVYAISSLTEGLPITLLEAMQYRTPIVATAVGGIPDVITDKQDGLLVKPCDPTMMAEALHTICSDSQYSKKMTENAYRKLTVSYSSRTMAAEYVKLYKKIIAKVIHSF